nr:ribonuclease H-like domain-containing protein [Tanacetum cinerariifolium]
MAMLTMRARRLLKKTKRKLTVNGNESLGFDMSKVKYYNYHKRGHFAKEYRALRNQDFKHKESIRRSVPVETSASTDLVSYDGLGGYDWSDQAEEGPNYALMAYTSSSSNSKKGLGYEIYNAVSPPYTGNFIPLKPNLTYIGLDKFAVKPVVENKSSEEETKGNPQMDLRDKGVIDSRCSRNMTRNMSYLTDYKEIDGGYVAFGGNPNRGKITGKGGLSCLFAKATFDESKLWHRMLGHLNFKTMNKLVKGNPAEAVNTACYVQNRVLVVKPHNKTPYELFHGRTPTLSFMRPFGCPVTILNTKDPLSKFDGKTDEEFFVGYSLNSKAFRVFNSKTRIVEENLHIRFSKSTPNVVGSGPDWLFDIDALIRTMNYKPTIAGTQSNGFAGTKASGNAGQARKEITRVKDYILLPSWTLIDHFPNNQRVLRMMDSNL